MITIHGVAPSPFVRKVRVVLAEKGIAYEMKPQPPFNQSPEFFEISPLGKIPVLEDGDFTLPDSSAVSAYLERVQPNPSLYPADPREYGRALWLEEYSDSKLVDTAGPIFFERIVKPKFFNQGTDEARVREHCDQLLPPVLDYLEKTLGDRKAFAGGSFSIADIAIASILQNLRHGGEDVNVQRWPNLAGWLDCTLSRPSFKTLLDEERSMLGTS